MFGKKINSADLKLEDAMSMYLDKDIRKLGELSESKKESISRELVSKVFDTIKEKSMDVDYKYFEDSEGDIEKIKDFEDLQNAINFLRKMKDKENGPDIIVDLSDCLVNLIHKKREFIEGFKQDKELIKMTYCNVAYALVSATSYLIAAAVEYSKDDLNLFKASFNNFRGDRDKNYFFEIIKKFNKFASDGKLDRILEESLDSEDFAWQTGAVGSLIAILILLFFIRQAVYSIYYTRDSFAKYLEVLAYYVDLNQAAMSDKDMKKVKERQQKIVKKLRDLADKIKVTQKVSSKKAEKDIEKDDREIEDQTDGDPNSIL